jgi:hypothetical protein
MGHKERSSRPNDSAGYYYYSANIWGQQIEAQNQKDIVNTDCTCST